MTATQYVVGDRSSTTITTVTTPGPQHWLGRTIVAPFRVIGLTADDGWPSFAKIVTILVIVSYFIRCPIPLGVSLVVVSAAHGTKVLLALINSKSITATENMNTTLDIAKTDRDHASPRSGCWDGANTVILTPTDAVLNVARSLIGISEQGGANAGQMVETFLKFVGLKKGEPWCAAFVSWVGHAALNDPWPVVKTGGCAYLGEWATQHNILVDTPQPGDIALYYFPTLKRFAHTGLVELSFGAGKIAAIEGNTNTDGSRDGWEVARKTRTVGIQDRFIRWTELLK